MESIKRYITYVLHSPTYGKIHIGYTGHIKQRMLSHNKRYYHEFNGEAENKTKKINLNKTTLPGLTQYFLMMLHTLLCIIKRT